MRCFSFFAVLSLVLLGMATSGRAAPGDLLTSFQNPVPHTYAAFGWAVAGSPDTVLVGAPNNASGVVGTGSAYVFDASGNLMQSLQNPVGDTNDGFGYSVAVGNGNLLVGAPYAHAGGVTTGVVYLFGSNGAPLRTFANPTQIKDDAFGTSVALNGTKVLVGAPGYDKAGDSDAGAAYLFDISSGSLLRTIIDPPNGTVQFENFGSSVAWVGDNILVGAQNRFGNDGVAYLFDQSGNILQSFHSPAPVSGEYFGTSVAGIGNNVLIGAPGWQNYRSTTTAGAVYLFNGGTGALMHSFLDPAATLGDLFGLSVAGVGTDGILIGAPHDNYGAAYLFDSTGNILNTYHDPVPTGDDRFGYDVTTAGNNILIGAFGNNTGVGVAYTYQGVPEPSTFALLGVGTVCLLVYAGRKRFRSAG